MKAQGFYNLRLAVPAGRISLRDQLGAILGISTAQYNKDVLAAGKADYMSIKREDVSIPDTGY